MLVHALDGRSVSDIVLVLAREIRGLGHRCPILTTSVTVPVPPEVEVIELGGGNIPTVLALRRIARALREVEPAALIAHVSGPNLAAALGRGVRWINVDRLVLVEHVEWVSHPDWRFRNLRRLLTNLLYRCADAVVGVSPGVCEGLRRVCPALEGRLVAIPPPVARVEHATSLASAATDHPWFEGRRDAPLVVTVGNVIPRKDHETLIRAIATLGRGGMAARLAVIGRHDDPELLAELVRVAQALGIADRIQFLGYRPDPLPFVARADVFVLTSRSEGFGLVLVEAMACGVPVVSTDPPGGPRWILQDGESGLLVPTGDPAALARAIHRVLTDGGLRRELTRSGLERARDFAPRVVARQYLRLAGFA